MKLSLSELWQSFLDRFATEETSCELTLRTFLKGSDNTDIDAPLTMLKKEGFAVPTRNTCQEDLCAGIGPLPKIDLKTNKGVPLCRLVFLINMIWRPILRFVEGLICSAKPEWSDADGRNYEAISLEMSGIVFSPDEGLTVDKWVQFISDTLQRTIGVRVPEKLITSVVSDIHPGDLSCTRANAYHLMRSSVCARLVGPAMAEQVGKLLLAEVADLPARAAQVLSEQDLAQRMKQDIVALLEQLYCEEEETEADDRPAPKKRRGAEDLKEMMKHKTETVKYLLENRIASQRLGDIVVGADQLISKLVGSPEDLNRSSDIQDVLVCRQNVVKHLVWLDGAVDRVTSDTVFRLREQERFAGVALATDESPPSQPRFRGLRFQITVLYYGSFRPLEEWEASEDPPLDLHTALADIMHSPGKKGVDVSRIIEKQLARVGLNCFDVVSCTGDGGGENEGSSGIHAHFEDLNPGYVRRRCLPHIAWRVCDQAIKAAGLDFKALAAYLTDGVTWSRLREIAVQPPYKGGLNLFKDGSRQCMDLFGTSPAALVVTRPETDLRFLRLLQGKEYTLHRCAVRDLEQRTSLAAETKAAVANLGNMLERMKRTILCEVLERTMFLYHWNGKHGKVATRTV